MDAIIYTSNSGFTEHYAKLLGEKTGLPVYSLDSAESKKAEGGKVIYLGWLMAGMVKGCKKAIKCFTVCAVCAVGMGAPGTQTPESITAQNHLPQELAVFYLQGGFELSRLHGIYRFMMSAMSRGAGKKLGEKQDKTPEELDMLEMMQHGGDRVKPENLAPVLEWFARQ